ncbi:metallophosphoesterase family protein [Streptococcus constellatus]|uniref:metallophosphoesterase family protein n=1 Tax=Streptococcus constellatus TaxID=76860 RepID=UPI00200128B2|nr:metallophosphoesterase family protein [Streptococcus constellatus]
MNHKIAIISYIHGNTTALQAVISGAQKLGANEYWLLGDILLPGPVENDLFDLLKSIPITAAVRGNWDDCVLKALDGEYGLDEPQEVQFLHLTQYLMGRIDPAHIAYIRNLPMMALKEVNGLRFALSHNLPDKNYGANLQVTKPTEDFDRLVTADIDVAVYGHIHKQLLRYASSGQQILNPGTIGMPYFDWQSLQNHRAQYTLIEVEEDGLTNISFRKVGYDYEAELAKAVEKGMPYIELYEELRREDNYPGHNNDLLARLNAKYAYDQDVVGFFEYLAVT